MPMFFVSGRFKEEVNPDRICGLGSIDLMPQSRAETGLFFAESTYNVVNLLRDGEVCHYGNINERDIYFIYDKSKQNEGVLKKEITRIIKGDMSNVINHANVFIDTVVYQNGKNHNQSYKGYCNETIFWDVLNSMIIVLGSDNLEKMAYALEAEFHRKQASQFNHQMIGLVDELIANDNISSLTRKILSIVGVKKGEIERVHPYKKLIFQNENRVRN
jgi:hypothetical protein